MLIDVNNLMPIEIIELFNNMMIVKGTLILKTIMKDLNISNDKLIKCADEYYSVSGKTFVDAGLEGENIGIAIEKND
jgi:hypothetical protein